MNEAVSAALTDIYERNGYISPQLVVNEAKDPSSVFHSMLEWDSDKALEEYQLWQARQILRRYKITYAGEPARLIHVTRIVSDRVVNEYHPTSVVVQHEDMLQSAQREFVARVESTALAFKELEIAAAKKGKSAALLKTSVAVNRLSRLAERGLDQHG